MASAWRDAAHSDVLIVGAGSAGSVVAERLSADADCRVTLIEAGVGLDDPGLLAQTADGLHMPIGESSRLVRRYEVELTQQQANRATIVRGSTVGGSGAINGGYFCRGLPSDFDTSGVPGWGWSDVIDHFRAIETDLDFRGPAHGDSGPIPIRRTPEIAGSTEVFVNAAQRAGYSWIPDLNDAPIGPGLPNGVGPVPCNIVGGRRIGPGAAYLVPALGRANLRLLTQTRVVRIRIEEGRAIGVEAVGPDGPMTVTADRIVLSAGAIHSAHLLMLSGIGDEAMLRSAGVGLVVPLPVGLAFSDHPEWLASVDLAADTGRPPLEVALSTSDNLEIRPYTSGFDAMTGAVDSRKPDMPHLGIALMCPRARGRITLLGADPQLPLRIEHRYDSEPDDTAALEHGVQLAGELLGAKTRLGPVMWATLQHLCGSAPMGGDGDERAVVDPRCRVKGVDGLWVIDGSVLPRITSRGPHATIVMLAHRAAEFVQAG